MPNPPKPEPVMAGVRRNVRTEPMWVGWTLCVCRGCGRRGQVNKGLLKRGQTWVDSCVECREDS